MLLDRDCGVKDWRSRSCFFSGHSFAPQMNILSLITFGALLQKEFIVGIKFQLRLFKMLSFLPVNSHNWSPKEYLKSTGHNFAGNGITTKHLYADKDLTEIHPLKESLFCSSKLLDLSQKHIKYCKVGVHNTS